LAIARELCHMMGGEIGVESELGKGSTFWFTLRAAIETQSESMSRQARFSGLRCLVVDDNPNNLEILAHYLGSLGIDVDTASHADDALQRMRVARQRDIGYHLAFIDMKMPDCDGLETGRRILDEPGLRDVVRILLTSISEAGLESAAREAGYVTVMHKPIRQSDLPDVIARALQGISETVLDTSFQKPREVVTATENAARVLLVEDNVTNQELAMALLELMGCQVSLASNGREALLAASEGGFDLILMDCQMPEMDGYEATRRIRAMEGADRHVPIIAMTANVMDGDRETCLACGMDDFLPKPYHQSDLRRVLRQWAGIGAAVTDPEPRTASGGGDTAAKTTSRFNPEVLEELRDRFAEHAPTMLTRLIQVYLDNSGKLLATMDKALEESDATAFFHAAHTFKSSSANLGVARCSELSRALEMAGRANRIAGLEADMAELRAEFGAASEVLRRKMKEYQP
jgi:CheY-like chemotaxis protein/HPt (histidine-containing phosphotransfer) domain-containing protein